VGTCLRPSSHTGTSAHTLSLCLVNWDDELNKVQARIEQVQCRLDSALEAEKMDIAAAWREELKEQLSVKKAIIDKLPAQTVPGWQMGFPTRSSLLQITACSPEFAFIQFTSLLFHLSFPLSL
jgi:hypothetical protein